MKRKTETTGKGKHSSDSIAEGCGQAPGSSSLAAGALPLMFGLMFPLLLHTARVVAVLDNSGDGDNDRPRQSLCDTHPSIGAYEARVCERLLWRGLSTSAREPRKEVRYLDDLDTPEAHEPEEVILSRHDGLRAGGDGAFEHAVVVGIGRDGVDGLRWRDVRSEFRDALDGLRRARFRPPELPQQMPTDFLNDWIGDRDLDLPVDGHFEDALWLAAEHEAGEVDVRV